MTLAINVTLLASSGLTNAYTSVRSATGSSVMSGASRCDEAPAPDTVPASRAPITPSAGRPRRSSLRDLFMLLLWFAAGVPAALVGWCAWLDAPPDGPVPGPSGAAPTGGATVLVRLVGAAARSDLHHADHLPGVGEGGQGELEWHGAGHGDDPDEGRCVGAEGVEHERGIAEAVEGDRGAGSEPAPGPAQRVGQRRLSEQVAVVGGARGAGLLVVHPRLRGRPCPVVRRQHRGRRGVGEGDAVAAVL